MFLSHSFPAAGSVHEVQLPGCANQTHPEAKFSPHSACLTALLMVPPILVIQSSDGQQVALPSITTRGTSVISEIKAAEPQVTGTGDYKSSKPAECRKPNEEEWQTGRSRPFGVTFPHRSAGSWLAWQPHPPPPPHGGCWASRLRFVSGTQRREISKWVQETVLKSGVDGHTPTRHHPCQKELPFWPPVL